MWDVVYYAEHANFLSACIVCVCVCVFAEKKTLSKKTLTDIVVEE